MILWQSRVCPQVVVVAAGLGHRLWGIGPSYSVAVEQSLPECRDTEEA